MPVLTNLFVLFGAIISGLLAVFLFLEMALRVFDWSRKTLFVREVSRKDYIAKAYHPYLNWIESWEKPMFEYIPIGLRVFNTNNPIPGHVTNNRLGFRSEEFTTPEADTFRLALLGGSAAWGSGASSNQATIAGQLEELLNTDARYRDGKKRAQCFNLGQVNGYQTQDLLTILFYAGTLQPAVVISFTGWNELVALGSMRRSSLAHYRVFPMSEMDGWQPSGVSGRKQHILKEALASWGKERFRLARWLLPRTVAKSPMPIAEQVTLGTSLFLEHLEIMQRLARAYGFFHLQALQPNLYQKSIPSPQEQRVLKLYDEVRPAMGGRKTGDYLREKNIYARILDATTANPERYGAVADLSHLFADEPETMYYTLVHMTDEGYGRVAQRIAEVLASRTISPLAVKQ